MDVMGALIKSCNSPSSGGQQPLIIDCQVAALGMSSEWQGRGKTATPIVLMSPSLWLLSFPMHLKGLGDIDGQVDKRGRHYEVCGREGRGCANG